jgi:glycosyltransferase involved in cell wall biosynthesis
MRFTRMACDVLTKRYPNIHPRFFIYPMATEIPVPAARRADSAPLRLLWVGRLVTGKRIDLALDALARAAARDWRFDVVGDGAARSSLEEQSRRLGIADRVFFHGFQSDPAEWYGRADLLLFPSRLENFPVTMVEAMSHGVACLAMRGDGVRYHNANAEIIEHGRNGFLADSDEHFNRVVGELIARPEQLRAAGDAARQSVIKLYTWDRHLDRYEQLFGELAGSRLTEPAPERDLAGMVTP